MANVTRFDPFNDIVDDLFKGFFVRPVVAGTQDALPRMRVEVAEKNGAYAVTAELPGVKKEDIKVEIDDNRVGISAHTARVKEERKGDAKDELARAEDRADDKAEEVANLERQT